MKYLFIILFSLLLFPQERPDSTKIKLKRLIIKQEKQTKFDSLMIQIAKKDSVRKAKKKK